MNKMNEALRDLFLKSKFTQEKFAKILGISRNRLCNVLYNKQKLKYVTFMKYQEKYEAYLERLEKTKRKIIKE